MACAVFAAGLHSAAWGQVISVEYDLNVPASSSSEDPAGVGFDSESDFALRLGILTKNYASSEARHRWSFYIGFQSLETTVYSDPPVQAKYSANSIEIGHDWLVLKKPWVGISLGASGGLVFAKEREPDPDPCYAAFCWEPSTWGQLSLYTKLEFPISSRFGLMAGVRGWVLSGSTSTMFPFDQGPIVSVGVQFLG